jgi:hypothetical protein
MLYLTLMVIYSLLTSSNNLIVGSGPSGYFCIVGYTGSTGTASNQLYHPQTLVFDSYGNFFVVDSFNINSCGKIESYLLVKDVI